ncbi:MAG: PAS domain S-box protein [Candidatus Margulisbacteria bacterium]|jgi:PAS domain S-box-containing protein|nr:PAS domain S-box protein [Candidatus Margulisiibacteriota bacterium]
MPEEITGPTPSGLPADQLRQFQQVVEQSPSTVMITDNRGSVTYVNPKFYDLTGYRADEIIGRNVRTLKLGDQPPEIYRELWAALKAGREWRGRFHNLRKDGTPYWENVSLAPLRNDRGETTHYIKVAEDFTRVVELEKLKDDLTHLIVHDLKNPLSGIVASVELFLAGTLGPLTPNQRKFIETIQASGKKLTSLIMNMLDVNKLESNKLEPRRTVFLAAALIKNLAWLEASAKKEEKVLTFDSDPALPINADFDLLTRVLENLAGNALKHTPRGGRVTLSFHKEGNDLVGAVSDTGEGIPAEYLDKVFDKFFKVSGQSLGTRLDTGLGLTFCKLAIEAHGGRIGVESTIGQGSRFYFRLPQPA